jgi:hypothetical protein
MRVFLKVSREVFFQWSHGVERISCDAEQYLKNLLNKKVDSREFFLHINHPFFIIVIILVQIDAVEVAGRYLDEAKNNEFRNKLIIDSNRRSLNVPQSSHHDPMYFFLDSNFSTILEIGY